MFRDLIPLLADRFHLAAPDLPGFGRSDMPGRGPTFDSRLRIHHKSWSDWVLWITRTMIGTERSNCMRWQDHVILEQFPALSVPKACPGPRRSIRKACRNLLSRQALNVVATGFELSSGFVSTCYRFSRADGRSGPPRRRCCPDVKTGARLMDMVFEVMSAHS